MDSDMLDSMDRILLESMWASLTLARSSSSIGESALSSAAEGASACSRVYSLNRVLMPLDGGAPVVADDDAGAGGDVIVEDDEDAPPTIAGDDDAAAAGGGDVAGEGAENGWKSDVRCEAFPSNV